MKRLIALLMATVLGFSLVACSNDSGSNATESKENIIEATPIDIVDDVHNNEAAALNNTYRVTANIKEIKSEYVTISGTFKDNPEYGNNDIIVYLPSEILSTLEKDMEITFTGKITNISDENTFLDNGSVSWTYIEFEDAKLEE